MLALPRDELEKAVDFDVEDRNGIKRNTIAAGEGRVLLGPCAHTGAGTSAGQPRVVLFLTCSFGDEPGYNADFQIAAWVHVAIYALIESPEERARLYAAKAVDYRDHNPPASFGKVPREVRWQGESAAAAAHPTPATTNQK